MNSKVLVATALLAVVVAGCGSQQSPPAASVLAPTATEAPTPMPTLSPMPSLASSEEPTPSASSHGASTLTFEPSTIAQSPGQSRVRAMTPFGSGLIAVGVSYEQRLPIFGPMPPHTGRIWSSDDGRAWEDVTPPDAFANIALTDVVQRTDGTLMAVGDVAEPNQDGDLETVGVGAWQSSDGITWQEADTGLPSDRWVRDLVRGDQGIVAVAWKVGDTHGSELWFSADGRTWERIRHLAHGAFALDAGTEGFVAVGATDQYIEDAATFVHASADGREWFEAADPPQSGVSVAAIGADWVALSANEELDEGWISTSTSENGLDWSAPSTVGADEVRNRTDENGCPLVPSLISAGETLILRTFLGGLCSEGGVTNFGPHLVRTDAGDWEALPFAPRDAEGDEAGSWVSAAGVLGETLVLAGEANGQAAFWWAEQ